MFYYLDGTVAEILPGLAVIDCGGVGYACMTTNNTLSQLKKGEKKKLYTYLNVGESIFDLYGFATQNELRLDGAKALVANGCYCVAEGANMPSTPDAIAYLQQNGILFAPAKASNAGGVATSGLEMSQNSLRLSWTFEEVDERLHNIMVNIYKTAAATAEKYGMKGNLVAGANIAGFEKIASAMMSQGIV